MVNLRRCVAISALCLASVCSATDKTDGRGKDKTPEKDVSAEASAIPRPLGTISSGDAISIDGTPLSPKGASSWPVMTSDEIATVAPALLTTNDHNSLVIDPESQVKVVSIPAEPGKTASTYIYVRKGGLSFDAKSGPIFICAGGNLFVPAVSAKGAVRMQADGSVSHTLTSGAYAEAGTRSCTATSIAGFLLGVPGAAGAAIAPIAGGASAVGAAGAGAVGAAGASAASIGAAAVGVGTATAAGATSFTGTNTGCGATGCNANPASVSPVSP